MSATHIGRTKKAGSTLILASLTIALATVFVFASTPTRAASQYSVSISDNTATLFSPQGITVNVGDTVTWTCQDGSHTVTSTPNDTQSFSSPTLTEGGTFSVAFTSAGNQTYYSTNPSDQGEVGWVFVQQPSPEFPSFMLYITVAAAVIVGLLLERRLRA